jgi:hypothetical protein
VPSRNRIDEKSGFGGTGYVGAFGGTVEPGIIGLVDCADTTLALAANAATKVKTRIAYDTWDLLIGRSARFFERPFASLWRQSTSSGRGTQLAAARLFD